MWGLQVQAQQMALALYVADFCVNTDTKTAMKALKEKGRRIPEDVRIAGVGNNWADLVSTPTLTTVQLFQRRCGSEAAKLLLQLIGEEEAQLDGQKIASSASSVKLGYRIIERESI